jgi:hypothetical protein
MLMNKLNIELCPETGICSIIKPDGTKVDLLPGEVTATRAAAGDEVALKNAVAEADEKFAASLTSEEMAELTATLRCFR